MTRVKVGELRDHVSHYLRRAAAEETIVIVNRDAEVAKLVPIVVARSTSRGVLGCLAGTATITGDLMEPIAASEDWFRE